MKMAQGETMPAMSEDRARSVFRQLVLGLAYLHHNQIVGSCHTLLYARPAGLTILPLTGPP